MAYHPSSHARSHPGGTACVTALTQLTRSSQAQAAHPITAARTTAPQTAAAFRALCLAFILFLFLRRLGEELPVGDFNIVIHLIRFVRAVLCK